VSALFTQCPGNTVQTETGKVDQARKFKYTTAARDMLDLDLNVNEPIFGQFGNYDH